MKKPSILLFGLTACLVLFDSGEQRIMAQPGPPPTGSFYTDGPIELRVRVREVNTLVAPSDTSGGLLSPDEFTYKIWISDSADLDGAGWQGGMCLTANFNPPGFSPDFDTVLFSYIYPGDTVPGWFNIRMDAWEDDVGSDAVSGTCTGLRCVFDGTTCCISNPFGGCILQMEDDNRCNANPFATNINYRLGSPGQWFDHGFITGTCGNTYLPRIESYWNYLNTTTDSISGKVISETGDPVQSVTLAASGSGVVQTTTNGSGDYILNLNPGSNYTVVPSKSNDINISNGVTAADILLIRRHILGTPLSSPYKIIAADVNGSGSVSTADVLLIRSMILQTISAFPGGRLWSFVPHDFVFADAVNPFPYDSSRHYASVSPMSGQDFIGMKLGDVNDSWNPSILKNKYAGKVYLKTDCVTSSQAGEEISIPIRAKQFEDVSGMQFTLSWDQDALTFQSVETGKLQADFATQKTGEGILGVLWTDDEANGNTLRDDEILFTLKFIADRMEVECDVSVSSAMIPMEAVNGNLELLELAEWKDENTSVEESSNRYRLYQNYPNPYSESTIVSFELPKEEMVTIEVFDLLGRMVEEKIAIYGTGRHDMQIEGEQFSPGVYYLQFKTENFKRSLKIVRLK